MPLQYGHGIGLGKILELNQNSRPPRLQSVDETINKCAVFRSVDSRRPSPHVHWIFKGLPIVCAHVKCNRQRVSRRDTTTGGVQGQLADRNTHAANPLVAQSQHPFPVGHHHHFNFILCNAAQYFIQKFTVVIRNKDAAGTAIDVREMLTGITDGRGINDREHFH